MCELETAEGKVQSYQWSGTHDLYGIYMEILTE